MNFKSKHLANCRSRFVGLKAFSGCVLGRLALWLEHSFLVSFCGTLLNYAHRTQAAHRPQTTNTPNAPLSRFAPTKRFRSNFFLKCQLDGDSL